MSEGPKNEIPKISKAGPERMADRLKGIREGLPKATDMSGMPDIKSEVDVLDHQIKALVIKRKLAVINGQLDRFKELDMALKDLIRRRNEIIIQK